MSQPTVMPQPMIVKTGGGSHAGSIILGIVVLFIIAAIGFGIYAASKYKSNKSSKWGKAGKAAKCRRKGGKESKCSRKAGKSNKGDKSGKSGKSGKADKSRRGGILGTK